MTEPTPESVWPGTLERRRLRTFRPGGFSRAAVVAAHPDDETLGAGGLLQRLHMQGTEVSLIVATDGDAAFPSSSTAERQALGRVRRRELRDSLRAQGLGQVDPIWLGLPDSGLREHAAELAAALGEVIAGCDLCLLPWPDDPHPDHQETGRAALKAAPITAHRWSYPIWLWHWLRPDDPAIPWSRACTHRLNDRERAGKSAAIAAFTSQLAPGPHGEQPILPPDVLTHFDRDTEIFFREPPVGSAPRSRFTELYDSEPDPWQVTARWYERRKRAVALAALPDEHYGVAVEPACGIGAFTRELARRCDRLVAFDPVPAAIQQARHETAALSNVDVQLGSVPGALPSGPIDLLVYSEILYYLDDRELTTTIERSVAALRTGGHLLAVHWRHWAPEAPRDARDAHQHLLGHQALEPVIEHADEEFVLHVLRRR